MTQFDEVPAIPLWIAGHAYLTLAPHFTEVRDACSGRVLRRTPSCGANEARLALDAAAQALSAWSERSADERTGLLLQLADALDGYASHFARLIEEETGCDGASALAEVGDAVALLRGSPRHAEFNGAFDAAQAGVREVVGSARSPLSALLRLAVPAWSAGSALVVMAAPLAPSAVFALAELSARCAFPGGVFNVLYGDASVFAGVVATPASVPQS